MGTMLPDRSDTYDCADIFETICAIQRRFSAYNGDAEDVDESLHRPMQVGATMVDSENSCLFVDRTNAQEGFLNCVDKHEGNGQKSQACDDAGVTQDSELAKNDEPWTDDVAGLPLECSQLPKSARTFIDAIRKNRSLQTLIYSKMMEMEARVEELNKLMERVNELRSGRALSLQRYAHVRLINLPKQRTNGKANENNVPGLHKGPSENPHVAYYKEALAAFPVSVIRMKWSKEERENLLKGLKQQFQRILLEQAVDELGNPNGSYADSNNFDSIICSIHNLDITPEVIRLFLPKVNWEQLSSMYVPGRSGAECQSRFLNYEDPLINHNQWTATEDKNLLRILQQKGLHNWIDIAAWLGTNRTPFQCLARYQRSLNASILKREWMKEEDDQLRAAVESYGESDWQLIASVMEGRTGDQCSNRWLKTLHPARKRIGKWIREEDKRLKVAVTLFGPKTWKKVAKYVPGRTEVQCRERWLNCLDPCLNMSKWSEEEDCKLKAAISEHGYCWSRVAACVPHRTDNQCWRRWKVLFPDEVRLHQAARKIQKSALISNFVSRESERPALGPNDFVQPEIYAEPKNDDPSKREKRKSRRTKDDKGLKKDALSDEICAVKKKVGPLPCNGGVKGGNSKRRFRMRKKRSAGEHEHPVSGEECGLPFMDPTLQRVIVSEERTWPGESYSAQHKTSKLHPKRKSSKPSIEVAETAYEAEMRAWDGTFSKIKIQEK